MVFELPEETELHGFVFTPVAGRPAGTPSHCRIFAWRDGEWQCIGGAEFSNVRANPVPQVAYFSGHPREAAEVRRDPPAGAGSRTALRRIRNPLLFALSRFQLLSRIGNPEEKKLLKSQHAQYA